MLVNEIEKWIDNEEEWFEDFLTEMTKDEKYGDDLSNYAIDDSEIDGDNIWLSYSYSSRCGDSDYLHANIPIVDVVRKLRKDKLDEIKNI